MTYCYDLMKEKAVLDSLDTGAEKRGIQEEIKHHANMMKLNDEWNKEVRLERSFKVTNTAVNIAPKIKVGKKGGGGAGKKKTQILISTAGNMSEYIDLKITSITTTRTITNLANIDHSYNQQQ